MSSNAYMMQDETNQNKTYDSPEQKLWQAVIIQALRDAFSFDRSAINWLLTDSKDVSDVFDFAGRDLEYTRKRMKVLILLMAKTTARNLVPKVKSKGSKKVVVWEKPGNGKRALAVEFLQSLSFRDLFGGVEIPSSEHECDKLLERAVMAANDILD